MRKIVPKTRCSGTLTEAGYFGMIRSALRRLSIRWKPRSDYLISVRRPYTGSSRRSRWEYPCSICGGWFIQAQIEVDHIVPAGSIKCFEDIGPFVERLLIEKEGYQTLCKQCHQEKTNDNRN